MQALGRVVGWALLGAMLAGGLTAAGFLLFNLPILLGGNDANEVQAWTQFAAVMGSLGMAAAGFVLGAVIGIWRAWAEVPGRRACRPR